MTPPPELPIEIISSQEMALIEAAFAAFSSSKQSLMCASSLHQTNVLSVQSVTLLSKRKLSIGSSNPSQNDPVGDIEDAGLCGSQKNKKNRLGTESLFYRFRRRRGLSVTDLTAAEWCEKQMEFVLLFGKPKKTEEMLAGSARHEALEEEVIKREKVEVKSKEDIWALKLLNFIVGANQLVFDGLTRELPLICFTEGVWIVGVIDEIQMTLTEAERVATLVDVKTRKGATLPSEPQRRNGRFQLMCYKHLWDTLVAEKFPAVQFFEFFALNPYLLLSSDIRDSTVKLGFPVETLSDVLKYYKTACCTLPSANSQLLLRYESQKDQTLLGEEEFAYDPDWLRGNVRSCLEFWNGDRGARYTHEEEGWKCRFCAFKYECPKGAATTGDSQS